jgi:acetyltransferase
MRVLGPGSFGIAAPAIGLNASRAHLTPRAGKLALVSQSAALCRAVLDWAEPNGVGFSHIVGIGGNADIGFGLVLDWLARDAGTGAILLELRRIKEARPFLSAARAAARLRPVVAIRGGGLVSDPTGDADAALTAALRRCGVLVVSRLGDMLAAAETLTRARPARGESLAIVTNAIGPGQLAADAALRDGLGLAALTEETRRAIAAEAPDAFLPAAEGVPVDDRIVYAGADHPLRLAGIATLLAGAPEVGGVLVLHAPTGGGDGTAVAAVATAAHAARVPFLVTVLGEATGAPHRRTLADAGVAVFASPDQAVRGFHHLVQDRRNRAAARELPPSAVLRIVPDREAVHRAFAAARAAGGVMLTQDQAMAALAGYGVPSVPTLAAADAAAAARAAGQLGYPVVLKRRRVDRPDSAASGGLALDLASAEQVLAAAAMLARRGPQDAGFLVQRQVGRRREVRIRVHDDPVFGPIIAFGQGGTAAHFIRDLAFDLPPLNLPLAHALIARTGAGAALGPLHDQPAADPDAVADTLVRISQLVVDFPAIAEIDVNPLFAAADGVLVADAWIRLRGAGEPPAELAIPPYPAELGGTYEAAGERFVIRPIRPEDAAAHGAFFRRLSPEDIRYRFFSALREMSPEQTARLTQIDYDREMAFIAVREATGETVGVARLVRGAGTADAEFAVVVQGDMRGRGLARHLMQRLMDWGRAQGMTAITGQVLADNAPMLAFVRRLGFTLRRSPGEPDIVEARCGL